MKISLSSISKTGFVTDEPQKTSVAFEGPTERDLRATIDKIYRTDPTGAH